MASLDVNLEVRSKQMLDKCTPDYDNFVVEHATNMENYWFGVREQKLHRSTKGGATSKLHIECQIKCIIW